MKRPKCKVCDNKIKDNTYEWVPEDKTVVHKICKKKK